jgi:large subunit ribosomal protein L10
MNRQEKAQQVEGFRTLLDGNQLVILTEYAGLDVSAMVALRSELRKVNAGYKVMKNTLAKRATEGTDMTALHPHFKGPVGVCFTKEDPAAAAKVLVNFQKEHEKLELKSGYLPGGKLLDPKGINALSKLPGKDELRAKLVGLFVAVPRNFVSLTAAIPRNFVGVIAARQRQLEGE